jgi:ribosomal-protein-alanine N-acetyltransferase
MSDDPTDDGVADPSGPQPDAGRRPVRSATPDDLPRLLAIQAAAFPDPHRSLLQNSVRAGLALVSKALPPSRDTQPRSDGSSAPTTVPAGYVLFTADGESVYVAELAVAPGHRRRGHGRRLLAAVAARHPDHERLQLTTRVDNEDARAFYASLGFREAERLHDHYGRDGTGRDGDPTDGLLLVQDLE